MIGLIEHFDRFFFIIIYLNMEEKVGKKDVKQNCNIKNLRIDNEI